MNAINTGKHVKITVTYDEHTLLVEAVRKVYLSGRDDYAELLHGLSNPIVKISKEEAE
ncbi:hypothetical protein [Lederbergia ruris]|uniref:hypothetical protein n=1 Tax=Lederbergia ruris TaxID=217495 RepID=UPI0039A1765D